MNYIDRLCPHKQSCQPLHQNPVLIYTHIYANTIALGLHLYLIRLHPPYVSKTLYRGQASTCTVFVTIGTVASILYASKQNYGSDEGRSGAFTFGIMALATFATLATALYHIYIRRNGVLHREWALRNFAVLFGNGVFFRVLAKIYLVYMMSWGADFYASWFQMIYLAWMLPLFAPELSLSWERSRTEPINGDNSVK